MTEYKRHGSSNVFFGIWTTMNKIKINQWHIFVVIFQNDTAGCLLKTPMDDEKPLNVNFFLRELFCCQHSVELAEKPLLKRRPPCAVHFAVPMNGKAVLLRRVNPANSNLEAFPPMAALCKASRQHVIIMVLPALQQRRMREKKILWSNLTRNRGKSGAWWCIIW